MPSLFMLFLGCYTVALTVLVYRSYLIYGKPTTPKMQRLLIVASTCFYVGGFFFMWIPGEILYSEAMKPIQPHALFHLTSAIGPYLWLVFAVFERYSSLQRQAKQNDTKQAAQATMHFIGPVLPYVVVEVQEV
jgi:hypothetical protein